MDILKKLFIFWILIILLNIGAGMFIQNQAYEVSWVVFISLIVILIGVVLLIVFKVALLFIKVLLGQNTFLLKRQVVSLIFTAFFIPLFIATQVITAEFFTYSPSNGEVSQIIPVNINQSTQYISVRTLDESNPVILFLAGGPGGTQMATTRAFLSDLESDYTVVNWDQVGTGKSYDAIYRFDQLTVEDYVADAHALTNYLKTTYQQEKIYLIGESWGSYLAVLLSHLYPDDYYAMIGTGQMVDFTETEEYCYDYTMSLAIERNDQVLISRLTEMGRPPIYGDNISFALNTYLQPLYVLMETHPDIEKQDWNTFKVLISPEYSIWDSIGYARGLLFTFSDIYQTLYGIDLRTDYNEIEIPVYLFHGKYDVNAPLYLVQEYYDVLISPDKDFVLFEHSGHNPWINEYQKFCDEVRKHFIQHLS